MTDTLYLTRARLRRDPSIASIAPLLLPTDASPRAGAAHQLMWSLFAGNPDAQRDFLWREDQSGTFFILSCRAPDESPVFNTETKEFAPLLAVGDKLRFTLRANATRSLKEPDAPRGKRADVVMAALKSVAPCQRASARPGLILKEGRAWLETQGTRHGFTLVEGADLSVDGYDQLQIPRVGNRPITVSTLEFDGALTVTDPVRFLASLARGFGHAKAFGCGLMLIRRA